MFLCMNYFFIINHIQKYKQKSNLRVFTEYAEILNNLVGYFLKRFILKPFSAVVNSLQANERFINGVGFCYHF